MQMLEKDPERRPTAAQLLQHPWLSTNAETSTTSVEVAEEIMADMMTFQKQNVFQTGVMSLITSMKHEQSELAKLK